MRRLATALGVTLVMSVAAVARAGGNDEATKHYVQGKKLLQDNKPEAALQELDASLELLPSPNTSLLRAHALRLANRKPEALEEYERTIEAAGAQLRKGEKRFQATLEEAGKWQATMRAELAVVVVAIRAPVEGTEVSIGGRAVVGVADPSAAKTMRYRAAAEPGNVAVEIRAPGTVTQTKSAASPAGEETTLRFDANQAAPVVTPSLVTPPLEVPPVDAPPTDDTPAKRGGPPVASLVLGGAGVVGVAVFVVFGSMAHSKKSELDACSPSCPESLRDEASAGKRDQVVADVAFIASVAAIAAGATLWIVKPKPKTSDSPSARLVIKPAKLELNGHF